MPIHLPFYTSSKCDATSIRCSNTDVMYTYALLTAYLDVYILYVQDHVSYIIVT